MNTAVLFIVFNRPQTTRQVFKKIRQVKPQRFYIASDGPRKENKNDITNIKEVRKIATKIDWPCEVKTLFREKNLGCKKGVSSAITWFFENEEQGIILEDDCVPHLDFFTFCENLLNHYSENERVSCITGNNFQKGKWRGDSSYYFSKFNHCWGWATWRNSWKNYDGDIKFWPKWKNSKEWLNCIPDKVERIYWERIFDKIYSGQIDSWAYPWAASVWYNKFLTATPNVNLVSNIGFGDGATHTTSKDDKNSNIKSSSLKILNHPKFVSKDFEADRWTFNYHYNGKYLRFPHKWILFPIRVISYIYRKIKNYL